MTNIILQNVFSETIFNSIQKLGYLPQKIACTKIVMIVY